MTLVGARAGNVPPPAPGPGTVLDKRYELEQVRGEQRLAGDVRSVLWRAVDTSLDRHVAVRTVTGLDADTRGRLLEAAAQASRVSDARFVRVLDVGVVGRKDDVVWLATEWVEAPSLAAVIRDEPMRPAVATELARQCTEALLAAERDGLRHGRLHAGQVLLPPGGSPRLTDLATATVLHEASPSTAPRPVAWDDVRGVGAVTFAAVTSRWPLAGW
jgi:eukaryotic-like serine/threonine-protein kinase